MSPTRQVARRRAGSRGYLDQPPGDRRIQQGLTGHDRADAVNELLGGSILQQES